MEPTVTASIWSCGDLGWCVSRGGGAHLRARGRLGGEQGRSVQEEVEGVQHG